MKKKSKKDTKQKNFKSVTKRTNRKLPYQHGLEVNGTLKFDYISSGTIVSS